MCFLEVALCEKYRSSHFQWEGGVKSFRTGGGYRFGGGYFCWGVGGGSVPHTCHVNLKKIVIFVDLTIFASADFTPFTSECTAGFTLG